MEYVPQILQPILVQVRLVGGNSLKRFVKDNPAERRGFGFRGILNCGKNIFVFVWDCFGECGECAD